MRGISMSILDAADEISTELIDFTREIVRIPSFTGEERILAEIIYKKLLAFELDDCWIDGIGNVVGVLRGQGKGPNVLLNSHMDVVPTGNLNNWHHDPFGAFMDDDGIIYGRGATDMKGGLASLVFTMLLVKKHLLKGFELPGDVIFSSVVGEEPAEMFGMEYLCKTSLPEKGLPFDVCFLSEPTSGKINLGHRGKVEIVIETQGKTAHSSRPWQGINALEKMLPVLNTIFHDMGEHLPLHPELGKCSITVTNLICKPGALSITPDLCEIFVDRRYTPDETIEGVLAEFNTLFDELRENDPDFQASVRVRTVLETSYTGYQKEVRKNHPVWIMKKDNPFVQKTYKALNRSGHKVDYGYFIGGVDGAFTAGLMGIPTIGYSGANETLAHSADEHTTVNTLIEDTKAYLAILGELYDIDFLDS
jgi:putative selenium metabolism hydrolase